MAVGWQVDQPMFLSVVHEVRMLQVRIDTMLREVLRAKSQYSDEELTLLVESISDVEAKVYVLRRQCEDVRLEAAAEKRERYKEALGRRKKEEAK